MSDYFNQDISLVLAITNLMEVIEKTSSDPRLLRILDDAINFKTELYIYVRDEMEEIT